MLTSGSISNSNQSNCPAIAANYVGTMFLFKLIITPNWTIDGYAESQVGFIKVAAKALNSTKSDYSAYTNSTLFSVCIPKLNQLSYRTVATMLVVRLVLANMFVAPGTFYDQSSILTQL